MNSEIDIHIDKKFLEDVKTIINKGRSLAYAAIDSTMISTYWNIGRRIVEEEQKGSNRAAYGTKLLERLSEELTHEYGSGFSKRYLAYFRKFYLTIPDISILQTHLQNLRWSHIIEILRVDDEVARRWYLEVASEQVWSIKALKRNISTQYYERHYSQPQIAENKGAQVITKNTEILKTPFMGEFLGFKLEDSFSEKELESSIISHLKDFLMEMGRGFAFVARQQHVRTNAEDYFIDLVLYNVILKCYVLIDLKVGKITHQDVGQMDMYVRMYDELKRTEGDNPTIGILLCSETSQDIARFSILHDSKQLFASKYLTYLPTEQQLKEEIEKQKEIFRLQHIR